MPAKTDPPNTPPSSGVDLAASSGTGIENESGKQEILAGLKQGILIAGVLLAFAIPGIHFFSNSRQSAASAEAVVPTVSQTLDAARRQVRFADLGAEEASPDALLIADWVADSNDNGKLPFVIIDKKNTRVYVFDPSAKLLGATPVLLGAMAGDDSVTGIGKKPISEVLPHERTTPAGRFRGEPGRNLTGENVVWVDYDAAVSMHRVRVVDPKERRLERLATPTTDDNRISYGCVNIPVAFFENILAPVFKASYGIIYVLPEERKLNEIFVDAYDPAQKHGVARPAQASSVAAAAKAV